MKQKDIQLFHGNSLNILKTIPDNSIECIVSDPPYGIAFMGKDWDKTLPPAEIWAECFRVLKPGGYILAMSATRTYHRLAVQLEDLGFIVHPMIGWIFASGFPKATDLSKQFDKQANAKRKVIGKSPHSNQNIKNNHLHAGHSNDRLQLDITAPSTKLAKEWDGWKYGLQSLKPALEPIFMGQKPISEKRMTDNIKKHGVGAVNIDACRVEFKSEKDKKSATFGSQPIISSKGIEGGNGTFAGYISGVNNTDIQANPLGRFPANLIHDGSEAVILEFPNSKSTVPSPSQKNGGDFKADNTIGLGLKQIQRTGFNDSGSSARFFFTAKPSKKERDGGLEAFPIKKVETRTDKGAGLNLEKGVQPGRNNHPTVKPIALMEYLIKLVCPHNGTVLDPFMGSGTTGLAAKRLDKKFIGIELSKDYFEIAQARINSVKTPKKKAA